MRKLVFILICFCLASFQNLKQGQQKPHTIYKFEPAVSTLTGILKAQVFYGPPGYGESPKIDKKETAFILNLTKPITVIADPDDEDGLNSTTQNVTKIQLVSLGKLRLGEYNNKTIKVSGTFFSAISGHHHTDVLLTLKIIEIVK